jgi:hypothetical protein
VLVISALIAVIVMGVLNKKSSEGMELTSCNMPDLVTTTVNFFVDGEIKSEKAINKKRENLQNYIEYSNIVLENSCIPMQRVIGEVKIVEGFSESGNVYEIHKELENLVGHSQLRKIRERPDEYYVLVLNKSHDFFSEGVRGSVNFNFNDSFALISEEARLHVLEHELGHLAWAMHPSKNLPTRDGLVMGPLLKEHHHKVKPFARGYKCGDAGTVMTYEKNQLPIYSNPHTTYQEEVCGDPEVADNARVLKEYAKQLILQRKAT